MAISLRDRRTQLIVAGGLVLVLIVLLFLRLSGGGNVEVIPIGPPVIVPSASPSPTPSSTIPPIVVFGGRDPFQPQFATASPTLSPTISPSGSTSPTFSPSPTVSPPPTSPPPVPSGGSSTVVGGHTVVLIDIFRASDGTKKAQVEVDGVVYTVAIGQTFAGNFRLTSIIGDPCGNFVFGEDPFQLCETANK